MPNQIIHVVLILKQFIQPLSLQIEPRHNVPISHCSDKPAVIEKKFN